MKWNKFSEIKPKHKEKVLVGRYLQSSPFSNKEFDWIKAEILNPFEENEMYNPNYWIFSGFSKNGSHIEGKIEDDWLWSYVEVPNFE